jgi:DNA polymerase-4
LAKIAAGLDKPDGLTVINAEDIWNVYGQLDLVDLPGINHRFERRLNRAGIFTPLEFLDASVFKLKGEVFQSIVGYYWYIRLRGHEIDAKKFPIRSFGNDFAIKEWTFDREIISSYVMKLSGCENMTIRLMVFISG